ncbi:MAG: SoxR reducing system RseC family protein [Bacteroidales bacterium]|nr:SoxR reducing system RseC family protein [Bacteroidales bacterium]MDD2280219.1 SoxR reducing system RseC family protein [Bacteroidales bacterium]MDD4292357.1 SoxR reducing system RseC family protein [Bacteroidales bacterium]MDD4491058.1 SoxR reducing system RseC family protein [Bacteroidales bacterium]HNW48614.1 SoxR reducing system RseC family protein [Bacteroidales bacterium]
MKNSGDIIEHQGEIIEIGIDYIMVEIISQSACSSCNAKSMCSMSETESKVVEVENKGYEMFEIGETVNVILRKSLGFKALYISYLIPLLILILILLSLSSFGIGELTTGLSIIMALAVYYIGVYLLRDKFKREFVFTIEKLNK